LFGHYKLVKDIDDLCLFESLPQEILFYVMLFLDVYSIGRFSRVNKAMRNITNNDDFWKLLFRKIYPSITNIKENWKEEFKNRYKRGQYGSGFSGGKTIKDEPFHGGRLLMLGLDGGGKTKILYHLKLQELVTTIPTMGFNVESVGPFDIWDVGGNERVRPIWRHYFMNTKYLIWVVDATDVDRMDTSRIELHGIFTNMDSEFILKVLVLVNKYELPEALGVEYIAELLDLKNLPRPWFIQPCSCFDEKGKQAIIVGLGYLLNKPIKTFKQLDSIYVRRSCVVYPPICCFSFRNQMR